MNRVISHPMFRNSGRLRVCIVCLAVVRRSALSGALAESTGYLDSVHYHLQSRR